MHVSDSLSAVTRERRVQERLSDGEKLVVGIFLYLIHETGLAFSHRFFMFAQNAAHIVTTVCDTIFQVRCDF